MKFEAKVECVRCVYSRVLDRTIFIAEPLVERDACDRLRQNDKIYSSIHSEFFINISQNSN